MMRLLSLDYVTCIKTSTSFILMLNFISTVSSQCSGSTLVLTANETYQTLTTVNWPSHYSNNADCEWRIVAANTSHIIQMVVEDTSIEYHADCVYDAAEVYDGYNTSSTSLGYFCGTSTPSYASTSYLMTVTFQSDYSLSGGGFKAKYKSATTADIDEVDETEPNNVDLVTVIAGIIGGVALLVVIVTVIFIYVQSTKAKRARQRLARGGNLRSCGSNASTRVHPFDSDLRRQVDGPPPPPAYGDIFRTPMSPPPAYSEVDPNPRTNVPLPGTPEIPQLSSDMNQTSTNISTISHTPDVNSNTHFSTANIQPLVASQSVGRADRRYEYFSPRHANSQTNAGNSNRLVSNAGAVAAMQILNPSMQSTSPRTNQGNSDASLNSTNIAQGDPNGNGEDSNVVEVEVHRRGSVMSVVSVLSEISLPTTRDTSNASDYVQR